MAIIHYCCCFMPLKQGCVACGIYTLIYYTIMVVGGTFQVDTLAYPPSNSTNFIHSLGQFVDASYTITIGYVVCSVLTVLASVLLMMGVFVNNRLMLLPWIIMIVITTFADFIYTIYLISTANMSTMSIEFVFIVIVDFFICLLNMYCILCVVSQYQVYKSGTWSEDILVQGPTNMEGNQYDAKRSVTFISNGNDCVDKVGPKPPKGSHQQDMFCLKNDDKCDVQKGNEVPFKCISSNGLVQNYKLLKVDNGSPGEQDVNSPSETGLWTEGNCNPNRGRRRSSAKHVQFCSNIAEGESSSTDTVQVSSCGGDLNGISEFEEHSIQINPALDHAAASKVSNSPSTFMTSSLLECRSITTNL